MIAPSALRAGLDRMLQTPAVKDAVARAFSRYASVTSLRCDDAGGLKATAVIHGSADEITLHLARADFAPDGSHVIPRDIRCSIAGIDALLQDHLKDRRISIPEKMRPFLPMLKNAF